MSSKRLSPQQTRQKALDQAWKVYQEAIAPAREAYMKTRAQIQRDYEETEG